MDSAYCCIPHLSEVSASTLKQVLNANKMKVQLFENISGLLAFLEKEKPCSRSVLIVSPEAFEEEGFDQGQIEEYFVVVMIETKLSRLSPELRKKFYADAIIAHSDSIDAQELSSLAVKAAGQEIFGLDHYIPAQVQSHKFKICDHLSKDNILDQMQHTIASFGSTSDVTKFKIYAERIAMVTDELILNGVFRANPRFCDSDHTLGFQLDEAEGVDIEWRFDGRYLGISVADPFGSLDKQTALNYSIKAIAKSKKSLGKGLQIAYASIDKLIINVANGKRTEIIGLIDCIQPLNQKMQMPRSFHFYDLIS